MIRLNRRIAGQPAWSGKQLADPHLAADKPQRVDAMFAGIARRYDLANSLHTLGCDRLWRRAAARAAGIHPGDSVLDVACGTGALTAELAKARPARLVGLDRSAAMLGQARESLRHLPVHWMLSDAMALPFADGEFDVATIAFGLRNLPDASSALRELIRVLRPGGRLVVLEFIRPDRRLSGRLYRFFARHVIPVTGRIITGDREGAYRYLIASIDAYLTFEQTQQAIGASGAAEVYSRRFRLAPVGLHVAWISSDSNRVQP